MSHITFVMKPVHTCNARCIYCSAYKEPVRRERMDISLVETLFSRIHEYIQETAALQSIEFIWHGGEPLLMDEKFYYGIMDLQEKHLSPLKIRYVNAMQSNILLLTDAKARMLKQLLTNSDGSPRRLGTSYDPIRGIRVVEGCDYNTEWHKKKDLLLKHGIEYGVVHVVHRMSLEKKEETFRFFEGLHKESKAPTRFNPLYAEGRAKGENIVRYHLTPEEWGQYLVDMYKMWLHSDARPRFDPFQEYHDYHTTGNFQLSCESAGFCSRSHLGIDVDGSVYQCGRGIDAGSMCFGSIKEKKLTELMSSDQKTAILNRKVFLRSTLCKNCRWWEYCHGGCPNDAMISHGELGKKTTWCKSRRMFFDAVFGSPRTASAPITLKTASELAQTQITKK